MCFPDESKNIDGIGSTCNTIAMQRIFTFNSVFVIFMFEILRIVN